MRILFSDGAERTLLSCVDRLEEIEVARAALPAVLAAKVPSEARAALARMRPSTLIKAFRIAVRDALLAAKSTGGYPDDTLVEMRRVCRGSPRTMLASSGPSPM